MLGLSDSIDFKISSAQLYLNLNCDDLSDNIFYFDSNHHSILSI